MTLEAISRDDSVVGWVCRTSYGYSVGCNVAWGYVEHPEKITLDWIRAGKYQVGAMLCSGRVLIGIVIVI